MKIDVVRIVRVELENEEFELIADALHTHSVDHSKVPESKRKATRMREDLLNAYHGEQDPF